jgi:hypothetical protein
MEGRPSSFLDGRTPLVGLAVDNPPMELLGRGGAHLSLLDMVKVLGFVSLDADPTVRKDAGTDWTVEFSASTGQTEVRTPSGRAVFSGTIPLLAGDDATLSAAVSQGYVPVIAGPGVRVNGATGDVSLDSGQALWLFAPVTVSE